MLKKLGAFAFALSLGGASVPAFAFAGQEQRQEKKQPVKMTDVQLDQVTAAGHHGGLISVKVKDIDVNVQAQAQVAALSDRTTQAGVFANQPE